MSQIKISVKDMKGKETLLNVLSNQTINEGKKLLGHDTNRVWKFDGTVLDGNKKFSDYELDNGETIIATDKVVGG